VGVVSKGHPFTKGKVTAARFAGGKHISVSRAGLNKGPIDEPLNQQGFERNIVTIVDGFAVAVALARSSDLIATVPERHTGNLRAGMFSFSLPIPTADFIVSMLWHPRLDADSAHQWLRGLVRATCAAAD
jgi:DNA-binding transcriptional LysR family regulator